MPHERDKKVHPPAPHRGAPVDEVRPLTPKPKPPRDVVAQHERMDSDGGGSAPMQDAPKEGDLRLNKRSPSPWSARRREADDENE